MGVGEQVCIRESGNALFESKDMAPSSANRGVSYQVCGS